MTGFWVYGMVKATGGLREEIGGVGMREGRDRKKHNEKGFTLMELIVVMGIIAILAALLAPNVAKVLDQAALTAAVSDARAIKSAMDMYFSDQKPKQYPPSGAGGIQSGDYDSLRNVLSPYLALPTRISGDPSDTSSKASFTLSTYTRSSDKKSFTMLINAKDAAQTAITIKETGVEY